MPELLLHSDLEFPEHLRWQALSFKRITWPQAYAGERRFDQDRYPPEYQAVHFSLVEGKNLLSHAEIVRLSLGLEGETYQIYVLGAVFTFPPYRRRGFASQVVTAASDAIRSSGVDLGLLICDPALEHFYEGLGWSAQSPAAVTTLDGSFYHASPEARRMALLISERARRAQEAFLHGPLHLAWIW